MNPSSLRAGPMVALYLPEGTDGSAGIPALKRRTPERRAYDSSSCGISVVVTSNFSSIHVCRYAEMQPEEKNKISHRGRALEKLEQYLRNLPTSS